MNKKEQMDFIINMVRRCIADVGETGFDFVVIGYGDGEDGKDLLSAAFTDHDIDRVIQNIDAISDGLADNENEIETLIESSQIEIDILNSPAEGGMH